MTDEQRIEAVAKMVCPNGINDACIRAGVCECCREIAEHYLRAAYPELHGDKPSHWLAPWEASEEMVWAGLEVGKASRSGDINNVPIDHLAANPGVWLRPEFAAMRTAHLAKDQE